MRHLLLPFVAATLLGCNFSPGERSLRVAVSIPPHAWLVEEVAGDGVEVLTLVGPADTPETYQPTDAQVSRLVTSRVYFPTGVPFERGGWFRALASAPGLEVVDLGGAVDRIPMAGDGGPHRHGSLDPHVWLSPRRVAVQARAVAETLSRLDPEGAVGYRTNLESILAELEALDAELEALLGPYRERAFLVFHPAWGYLAADYGLRQIPIEVEGKRPTDAELTRVQTRARAEGIRVLFVQPQISAAPARVVADALGVDLVSIDPLPRDLPAGLREAVARIAESFRR